MRFVKENTSQEERKKELGGNKEKASDQAINL